MANGDFDIGADLDFFDPGGFDSPPISVYEEPSFLPTDPDIPLNGFASSFVGEGDIVNAPESGIPPGIVEIAVQPAVTFDWTQVGDSFTRVGQSLSSIVAAGRDVAAIVTGRTAPSVQARELAQRQAAAQPQVQTRGLLLLAAVAGGAWLLTRGRR